MKKLNKLFAILIAVLGVQTLSAQTWTAPVIGQDLKDVSNSTELYMYNVKADAFACSGMSWGTHATVKELQNGDSKLSSDVHRCRVSKPTDGQLQIMLNERTWLGGGGPSSTNDCWVDHASHNVYIYNEVSDNVYTLKPTTATNDSYLDCAWAYGGHITFSATNGYGNTEWAFVLRSDITNGTYLLYKAKKEMYDIYQALVKAGHDGTYADALATANAAYTASNATAASVNAATKTLLAAVAPALSSKYFAANSLFNNPDMRGFGDDTDWGNGLNAFGDGIFESWHSAETITQTQTGLPNGFYTVVFLGMYRQDGGDAAPTLTLTSGGNSTKANLKALTEIDFGGCSGGNKWTGANKPDDKYSAGEALAHTDAGVKVENFVVENGELTVTVAMPSTSQWLLCQGFQIYFKAESLDEYANLFYAAKSAAEAFGEGDLNDYAANQISTALSAAATEQVDKEWYQARTAELNAAVALANEVKVPYANFKSLITLCESTLTNSEEFEAGAEEAFTTAINTAEDNVASATTASAIDEAYNTVEEARRTYIQKADPLNGTLFDYTFKITNPGFDNGTNGWNCESNAQNKGIARNKSNGIITDAFFENWNPSNFNGTISQSISGLPSGKYLLKVAAFGNGAYAFANDEKTTITTGDGAWYEVEVAVSEGTLTFGIKNESAINWMGIDNASLSYKGFDVETAKKGITSLVSQAEALAAEPMNKEVLATLNQTIGEAENVLNAANPTRKELNGMVETLNQTIENAKASAAEYKSIATYIAKADGINESIASDYKTQHANGAISESLETIFQKLEVATYNYVTENFTYAVALSNTWNSTGTNTSAADVKGEHWSDNKEYTYKNQFDGWGDPKQGYPAGSWTIDFDQEVKLPAGEYVFKVAGRKSVDAILELVVTMGETELGTVNDFPSSNEALGINKAGATSFDANDPAGFAKEGKGYGWQWRYVRFVLEDEATVKVAIHAETNKIYNWVSFGDYTLQMTEETYLEANKDIINTAIAAAEALVNTRPMGDAENTALQNALNMTYETGDEMLEKTEALNTAVANAKAWVTAYNEAKAPLVAALDRFEVDYNNAENGALNHMNKGRWATAIEKAQAAAEAKDVTNSYDGFETATNDLNEALDAATISVNEYAALKSAIENAEELGGGDDWGSEPFQKSESAKESFNTTKTEAQTAYNAAEVDGEGVTTVIESLNTAINEVVLNAPTEGQRYYIKVATDGHGKNGNAWLVTLGATGDNNPTGYGINANNAVKGHLNQAFIFTQVEGNLYNISIERAEGTVYLTYGALNGSAAGWKNQQIQATTDAEKKGKFKIVPTGKNGVLKIFNTIDNNYLDCQDGGSIYTDTNIEKEEFAFELATETEVTLALSEVGWATLILPFDAELPEGVKAWSCGEADGETLTLTEAESLKANTPYLMNGEESTHAFTGYGLADKDSYTDGLFVGTYVDYQTTADGKTYVLQNQNGNLAFYLVTDAAQPWIRAYRSYMVYEGAAGAPKFSLGRGEGTTSIDKAQLTIDNVVIYDLMGRKVSTMEKGGVYIVNGKKVVIK